MNEPLTLRQGNRALNYALSHSNNPKVRNIAESLPELADGLYFYAQGTAKALLKANTSTGKRAIRALAGLFLGTKKQTQLANSILDLQLTAVFSVLSNELDDNDIASVLVDAILYQATGLEAQALPQAPPPLLLLGSEKVRGIHKYHVARQQMSHIKDIEAWTFGKEFAAVVYRDPMAIGHILSVSAMALDARVRAQWTVKYVIHGTKPTKDEEEKLRVCLEEHDKHLDKMFESLSKLPAG